MNFDITTFVTPILANDRPPDPGLIQFLPVILFVVMIYFLIFRPHRIRQKQLQEQVEAMKKGDKVISAGGIHGVVTNIKERTVMVKVAENVKLEFQKGSITTVIPKGSPADAADLSNQPASDAPLPGSS